MSKHVYQSRANNTKYEWVDNVTKHKYVATKDQQLGLYLSRWVIDITF